MKKNEIENLLTKGVEEIVVKKDLEKKLKSGMKLRIKHGVDPTSPDLHIGYAVVYHKLREFQELGHKIVFLIGDFTARFGDPTDKDKSRTLRDAKTVRDMASKYIEQVGKILDLEKTEIRYNSEWYDKMSAEELIKLVSNFTVARLLERDMFSKRIKEGKEIQAHEIMYPILQGYDSVMLKSDLTIIGTDQKFNELQGRKLQEEAGQRPQDIMSVPMLVGTDGKIKMSQSLGNYISLNDTPNEMFGKVMSIPDDVVLHYAELASRMDKKDIDKIKNMMKDNPRDAKVEVAKALVELYYKGKGSEAEAEFNRIFKDKQDPFDMPEVELKIRKDIKLVDILHELKLVGSKSEARRLIEQGGVKIDKAKISSIEEKIKFHDGMVIQVGKHKFVKIKTK